MGILPTSHENIHDLEKGVAIFATPFLLVHPLEAVDRLVDDDYQGKDVTDNRVLLPVDGIATFPPVGILGFVTAESLETVETVTILVNEVGNLFFQETKAGLANIT